MRFKNYIGLFLIISSITVSAQQTVKEGKVSYASAELVYVNFENTIGISAGDTLFYKIKNKYNPVLKVKYLSKNSLSAERLVDKSLEIGNSIFAFVSIKDSTTTTDIQNNLQTELTTVAVVEPLTTSNTQFV